jgi:hypothetical protein
VFEWKLHSGEDITEAELLRRAALLVDDGWQPVEAIAELWLGSTRTRRPFAASQAVTACTPWLERLAYESAEMAAAMRARAEFLEQPDQLCQCGHPYQRHPRSPCLPTEDAWCMDCRSDRDQ